MDFRDVMLEIVWSSVYFFLPVKLLQFFLFWIQFFLQNCNSLFTEHFNLFKFTTDGSQKFIVLLFPILILRLSLDFGIFCAYYVMDRFNFVLCRIVDDFGIEYFSVFIRGKVPNFYKMMGKVTHNYAFDRLANVMPRQTRIPLFNVINCKFSYVINVLDTTIVVLNSWVQLIGIFRKYFMLTTVISAIT